MNIMAINTETNIDTYSNNNEDNSIALYASTSVSNPYSFKITKNVKFSATCEEEWSSGGK